MPEESPIKIVGEALFKNKKDWINISDETKCLSFFIFNQRLSKLYPKQALLLNEKNINKSSAMDTWFIYLKDIKYLPTLWSKSIGIKKDKEIITKKDKEFIKSKLDLHDDDIDYLIINHQKELLEELKWYKDQQKN